MSWSHNDDVSLLSRLNQDDESALAEIVVAYRQPLSRYVARLLHPHTVDDTDDILQAVFFRLWSARKTIVVNTSLRAYLYTAARNQTLNHLRDRRNDGAVTEITPDMAVVQSPEAEYEGRALREAVQAAIDALPARCRDIFLLSREGGLTYPEIGGALGVSVNTVKTQMSRAFSALAKAAAPFLGTIFAIVSSAR